MRALSAACMNLEVETVPARRMRPDRGIERRGTLTREVRTQLIGAFRHRSILVFASADRIAGVGQATRVAGQFSKGPARQSQERPDATLIQSPRAFVRGRS